MNNPETQTVSPPVAPVDRWLAPVQRFLHVEASSGIVLLTCTAVALGLANSPVAAWFASLWKTAVSLSVAGFTISGDLGHLVINDGLMTIFFFVVGLEIKRHMVHGELRDPRKALLPMVAALGGVVLPAAIYLMFQWGEPGQRGWAVPMATDIAFVVGFLALFGSRVPFGLKILLLSLAIVDDLVAVLIIAFVFTETIAWSWLALAAVAFGVIYVFQRIGVRSIGVYAWVGIFIWFAFLQSGVHPTVAGVMLGLLTPARALLGEMASPLQRLEDGLHPWVAFGIMPLFALANAGVLLEASALAEPVAMAVAVSLAVGKPVGILLLCLLAVRSGLTSLPDGVTWPMLAGGACLAGIGFTMALFLNSLAFPGAAFADAAAAGKIGTLAGSMVSAVIGALVLSSALKR
jgi:NhaA family Na+:H+ antiporter